jgi:hypothetical protein
MERLVETQEELVDLFDKVESEFEARRELKRA